MLEEQPNQDMSSTSTARTGLAFIFLALAIPLGIWVLTIVNASINGTKTPAIVEKIVPAAGSCDVTTPAGKFELPKPVFTGLAYFVLYLFVLIPTKIAIALLNGSVSLLGPDFKRQLRLLTESIQKAIAAKQ